MYFEFEDINGANKSLLEVVGHDGQADLAGPNADARAEKEREVELKLILSSNAKGWNFSENFIWEKNVKHAPWEFGYALAAARPLRLAGGTSTSPFAAQNFTAGVEMYGGLGDTDSLSLGQTSHYIGPTSNWTIPNGPRISASPNFGLTDSSVSRMYRFGVAYEMSDFALVRSAPREELIDASLADQSRVAVSTSPLLAASDGSWLRRVPQHERMRQNHYAGSDNAVLAGGILFKRNCASCHGASAQGNGSRPSLQSSRVHQATDGELHWLLTNGNLGRGMPSWSRLPDAQRWQLVRYLHSIPLKGSP